MGVTTAPVTGSASWPAWMARVSKLWCLSFMGRASCATGSRPERNLVPHRYVLMNNPRNDSVDNRPRTAVRAAQGEACDVPQPPYGPRQPAARPLPLRPADRGLRPRL